MRRGRHHLCLLMLLLTLGVALREAPEIVTLCDDWSNDGTAVDYDDSLPELTLHSLSPGEAVRPAAALPSSLINFATRHSWLGPALISSSGSGQDILHFVCLLRK